VRVRVRVRVGWVRVHFYSNEKENRHAEHA